MIPRFEIFRDAAGEFRFRLRAGNGQIVLTSEGYTAKASAREGVESVKRNAPDESMFERYEDAGGQQRFKLKAKNGQVIGASEGYSSASARDRGIAVVGQVASSAETQDLTS